MIRVGIGYDVHKLVEERKLILGGEIIPSNKGLLGHSDADCLIHAIIDAILGAISQGDIGKHFPDTNEKYKDISSLKLLSYTKKILDKNKFVINNIDSTVIMQTPKIAKYIPQMKKNIADVLCIEPEKINIKATTEEGLGFTGKNEGVACQAICCVEKNF
jgi:2-C-methyl-D-erythritol 2,4-cyclodiphosphate synthase